MSAPMTDAAAERPRVMTDAAGTASRPSGDAVAEIGSAASLLHRMVAAAGSPLSAMIEISDRCNEVCVHCYQEQGRKGEMSTEALFGVIDQLADMGVLILTLSGGEATLRSDFLQIVEHARKRDFAIRLFSNGLTMTRELAQELARLAVQVVEISLYSSEAETHDFVTGVKRSFERTVAGIRHLVEAGVSVRVKTPVMSINEDEIVSGAYAAFARSLGVTYSFDSGGLMAREGSDRSPESFNLSDAALLKLHGHLRGPQAECVSEPNLALDRKPCGAGEGIHIEPNGELRACTMLDFDLGHALHGSIAEATARNERAQALRRLTWADLHGCRECDLRWACGRCYASALAQSGDALGPYPRACHAAKLSYQTQRGLAPQIRGADGAADVGPYREVAPGVFERFEDRITPDDEALAQRLGWTRRAQGAVAAPGVAIHPGDLIQIRRPGKTKPTLQRVPVSRSSESLQSSSTAEVARELNPE